MQPIYSEPPSRRTGREPVVPLHLLATGGVSAVRELMSWQLRGEDPDVFRSRAVELIGMVAPVLVWMRDNKAVAINSASIRFALGLPSIASLAIESLFLHRDQEAGEIGRIHVPDMPHDLTGPFLAYLDGLPGYDVSRSYADQRSDTPVRVHSMVLFYVLDV